VFYIAPYRVVHHPDDIPAANMLAILLELCNRNRTAVAVLENSIQRANGEESDIISSNLGRQLRKLGRYDKAIECFKQIKQINFTAQCEFALTLFLGEYLQHMTSRIFPILLFCFYFILFYSFPFVHFCRW